ncbi:MAG: hypothetical protein AMXMBFR34_31340 [Myxococcaceae bacterium]
MAEVYLARDLGASPPRLCVLKRILPELAKNPDYLKMFYDESRIASLMTHPNVVRVFDTVRSPQGPFMVMEYLAGQDLHDVGVRARRNGLFIPWDFAVGLVIEAAEGIAYAHQLKGADGQPLQIVHRDLTPSNVFVTWDGMVKVLDFGIAHAQHRMSKTQQGMVKGKAQYLAPEQITGKALDGRVDQFALAVVLYQLLTGRPMFDLDNELACLHAILEGKRPSVREARQDVPEALEQVMARATRVNPEERFPSVKVFRDALGACLGAEVTREALGARLREFFPGEFESHAQLMGKLASAGSDELRRLYEGARHPEPSGARTELMSEPHRAPGGSTRRYVLLGGALVLGAGLFVALGAGPKKAPPPTGSITVRSDPPGATVVLDGKPTTWSTPVVLDHLALGNHRLSLSLADRKSAEQEVSLTLEAPAPTVHFVLPPLIGTLRLRVHPVTARVTIDGKPLPIADGQAKLEDLVAGERYLVRAEAPGFSAREVVTRVSADEVTELELELTPVQPPR